MNDLKMMRLSCVLALVAMVWGCDSDKAEEPAHMHTEMSDLETGCQHFEFGPHHPDFIAAADGDEAPMMAPHNHYTVAIPAAGGTAHFMPPAAGSYIILMDVEANLTLTDMNGAAVAPAMTMTPGDECPVAATALHFALDAMPYTLHFSGPATVRTVIHGPIGGAHMHDSDMGHADHDMGHADHGDMGHADHDMGHADHGDMGHADHDMGHGDMGHHAHDMGTD